MVSGLAQVNVGGAQVATGRYLGPNGDGLCLGAVLFGGGALGV
jgi:hypothetical protein